MSRYDWLLIGIFCNSCAMAANAEEVETLPKSQSLVVEMSSYAWIETLIENAFGYASVIIPGFLLIQYLKRSNYLEQHGMLAWRCCLPFNAKKFLHRNPSLCCIREIAI